MRRMALVIDLDRCIGCHACGVACKEENDVPLGGFWTRVHQVGPHGEFPDLFMYYLPVACQHCRDPACVQVCPTRASHRRPDGIVLIDAEKCIGCQACQEACPYGVRAFDATVQKVSKCTLCAHLLDEGGPPACVKTCPGRARVFGDLNDPQSDPSRMIRAAGGQAYALLPEAGTRPSVRYVLTRQPFLRASGVVGPKLVGGAGPAARSVRPSHGPERS